MPEAALAGEDHGDVGVVAAVDHVPVADRAAGLDDGGDALADADLGAVAEGEGFTQRGRDPRQPLGAEGRGRAAAQVQRGDAAMRRQQMKTQATVAWGTVPSGVQTITISRQGGVATTLDPTSTKYVDLDVESLGHLEGHRDRGGALPPFDLGQVALRQSRPFGQRLEGQAALGADRAQ